MGIQKIKNDKELCKTNNKSEKGTIFENKVAKIFDLMGYRVELDKSINNCQIDIYGELPSGPTTFKVMVECKDYKGKVGIEDVNKFVGVSQSALTSIDKAFMVSSGGFTRDAKSYAEKSGIECYNYSDLINKLINFDQYIDQLIVDYQNDELSKYYVDLDGIRIGKGKKKIFKPIDKYINKWLHTKGKNHISILGEYGCGKTSFCRKYAQELALKYKKNPAGNRIPLLINLRDYAKAMNIEQLITDLLVNKERLQNAKFSTFMRMNEEGLLLLLFDGFDEMAQRVDTNTTIMNFHELAKCVTEKSKVILTCRTEYFRTGKEATKLLSVSEDDYIALGNKPNFEIFQLSYFDKKKIIEFLMKRTPFVDEEKKGWDFIMIK